MVVAYWLVMNQGYVILPEVQTNTIFQAYPSGISGLHPCDERVREVLGSEPTNYLRARFT